jgi:RNA-directed DNA polymerase
MNILDPIFEKFQIYDSYACRKNKGTHRAVKRAYYFTKKYRYFIKLDIRKYFDSIHHAKLKELLRRKIKDTNVLNLLDRIIDSYETSPGRGIPIGNLTSQYFANYYLGLADRYVKETLGMKGYARYMDDMVLWGNDKSLLAENAYKIICYIQEQLFLLVKPVYANKCSAGVPFLGLLVRPAGIFLSQKSKKRFVRRYKTYVQNFNKDIWGTRELSDHVTAIIAWTLIAKSKYFRYTVFQRYGLRARTV